MVVKEKKISHGVIELRKDNILVFRPDIITFKEYNIDILKDLKKEFIEITDGIPRPYMCDNSHLTGIINKEEKEYINMHINEFATQMALITHSPVMNTIYNSYIAMFQPKMKIKLFKEESEAVKWLLKNN